MAGSAPHQRPLEALGASARARCARRAGAGQPHGLWLSPTPMRIPRRARGARRAPLHALLTVCAGEGADPNPPSVRPDQERDEHAARGRGDGTVRGSRPRTWGAHDGHGRAPQGELRLILPPHHITCGISGRLSSSTRARCCGPTGAAGGSATVAVPLPRPTHDP